MDELDFFSRELDRRLSSGVWDMAIARRVVAAEHRRRGIRIAFISGGLAAAVFVAAMITVPLFSVKSAPAEAVMVMQQVGGAYNASIGISSTDEIDPVDIEIAEALWSR